MIRQIEYVMQRLAGVLAWLMLALALLAASVLVLRYGFGVGSTALQELVIYLNAFLVMLGLSVTLLDNAHVRVDVVSTRWSAPVQALRDVLGVVFLLLPMIVAIAWFSWDYVARAWAIQERSGDAGGLAGVYWFKSFILLGDALLFIVAVVFAVRAWRTYRGDTKSQPVVHAHDV